LFVEVSDTQNLQAMFGTTAEITNVLWINIRDRRAGFVFKDSPGIVNAVFGLHGTAEVDGAAYGYFAGIPLRKSTSSRAGYDWDPSMDVDLFRVDLSDGDVRAEARSVANGDHDWIVGPDGKVAATAIYFTKDGTWRLHAGEGKNQPLREEKTPIRQLSLASLGRSAETFLISDRTGENDELQEVNAKTGEKTPILEDYNILGLIHDPVTHLLLGAQIAERPGAMFFDERLDARWRSIQKTFPGVILRLVSWNTGMTWAIVRSEGSRDSGTLWKVDMTTGTTKLLGYAYPAIRADRVGPNRMFQYKAQDGLEMEGVLTLPATGVQTNLPVVVMPHGGPIGPYDGIGFD